MKFSFSTPTTIYFGRKEAGRLGEVASGMGCNALLVSGSDTSRFNDIQVALGQNNICCTCFSQKGEPTVDQAEQGAKIAQSRGVDLVIAVGGGSVVDVGKAIAALATNPLPAMDYLEVIGKGKPLAAHPLPFVALPTTAGTGAEVTFNSVLAAPEHGVKVSLRSPFMAPDVAIVDPELSMGVSPVVTASSGMDALTQLMEAFISRFSNPLTDALCREGIKRVAASLKAAHDRGDDLAAREDMSLAALFSGVALANAKLGVVHGIAGPMGGMIPAPHGVICARLLGPCMAVNLTESSRDEAHGHVVKKLGEIASILTGNPGAAPWDAVQWIDNMVRYLPLPPLSRYGLNKVKCQQLSCQALKSSSMKGNPVPLTEKQLFDILMPHC
ncbi:Alcohol dehydrogenase, class IV [Desulfocicer vacuolatum DSM 3385]|uniref:Alcohol dehydrogenase, class IV n=1 Tax=Desulfocicer vacuolatum DSM 3385 TaxID=1121400 RepID=A0A1W2E2F0_9BACT|nr:iron-containing alcohol dehydrogenase [Desulfocicer vacuolatum]SMD03657.1 Alcohol dehydrogenase, class IV [Desulfocicer vacuolatum DSM 3385]